MYFNVALKEGEIIIYTGNCHIQLSLSFAHGFYFCVGQMNMLGGLESASEKSCMLASGNKAVNFEGLQFSS